MDPIVTDAAVGGEAPLRDQPARPLSVPRRTTLLALVQLLEHELLLEEAELVDVVVDLVAGGCVVLCEPRQGSQRRAA